MFGPYERKVHYYETDRMSIVHHSNYIRWFEEARLFYLEQIGVPYPYIESCGVLIPVLSVEGAFRKAFKYGDSFKIYLICTKFNGIKCEFEYRVVNAEDDEVYTTGKSAHCFTDVNLQLLNLKKSFLDIYEKMQLGMKENSSFEDKYK